MEPTHLVPVICVPAMRGSSPTFIPTRNGHDILQRRSIALPARKSVAIEALIQAFLNRQTYSGSRSRSI